MKRSDCFYGIPLPYGRATHGKYNAKGTGARRRRQGQTNDREPINSTGWAELFFVRAVIHMPVENCMYKCQVGTRLTNVRGGAPERFVAKARSPRPDSPDLSPPLHPLRQPAAVFLEQKASPLNAFSKDAMRFLIAR